MKSKLRQLAKLRQFDGGDPGEYLYQQMRQNLIAIEDAFRQVGITTGEVASGALCVVAEFPDNTLSSPTLTKDLNNYTEYLDTNDFLDPVTGLISFKEAGNYLFELVFNRLGTNGTVGVYLRKDGTTIINREMTVSTGTFSMPFSFVSNCLVNSRYQVGVSISFGTTATWTKSVLKITKV